MKGGAGGVALFAAHCHLDGAGVRIGNIVSAR
jgi:hypothetical protein